MKLKEVISKYEKIVPLYLQEEWDNSGLQIGDLEKEISKILISLDTDDDVLKYAKNEKYDLIINHHPLIFSSIKKIVSGNIIDERIAYSIKNDIAIYANHTNFDNYNYGTSFMLGKLLEIENMKVLSPIDDKLIYGTGVYGFIDETSIEDFNLKLKEKLSLDNTIFYGNIDDKIKKIAVVGGSGASFIDNCLENDIDLFITGDVKYHDADYAIDNGLNILDIGHYESEKNVMERMKEILGIFTKNTDIEIDIFYRKKKTRQIL